jgi:hypothetical protein
VAARTVILTKVRIQNYGRRALMALDPDFRQDDVVKGGVSLVGRRLNDGEVPTPPFVLSSDRVAS